MRKIIDYVIATNIDNRSCEEHVMNYIKEGYELYGDLAVTGEDGNFDMFQALVKYESEA